MIMSFRKKKNNSKMFFSEFFMYTRANKPLFSKYFSIIKNIEYCAIELT